MSILESLSRAGQFLNLAGQGSRASAERPAPESTTDSKAPSAVASEGIDPRDKVSLSGSDGQYVSCKQRALEVANYKRSVAQDLTVVRETLRHKLAEYGLSANSKVTVSRNADSSVSVKGPMAEQPRRQIEQDLNNSREFSAAFARLSVNEPTLSFMDNAVKLNRAYGVSNSLLDSLISENQQFNGLQDIALRYDNLRKTIERSPSAALDMAAVTPPDYAFRLNARA